MNNTTNNTTFVSISPGTYTGITLWGAGGNHIITGIARYLSHNDFKKRLYTIKKQHRISFAIIEDHAFTMNRPNRKRQTFSKRSGETQLSICKEIFDCHITIGVSQWNRAGHKNYMKRQIALQTLNLDLKTTMELNSALIGRYAFQLVNRYAGHFTFYAMERFAMEQNQWPLLSGPHPWDELVKGLSEQLSMNIQRIINCLT